jgi:5'-methylthioadenosine phosphorylase
MTAMPEAKLAREAQICYALIALVSDFDCWRGKRAMDKQTLLREIIGNLNTASQNCMELVRHVLVRHRRNEEIADSGCGCRKSLQLAVWIKEEQIKKAVKKRLGVLFE